MRADPATDTAAEALLAEGLMQLFGQPLPALQAALWRYGALLRRWNRAYNLTAIEEPMAIVTHHLLDSLAIWPWVGNAPRLLDVGTGAGLPAVPLALAAEALAAPLEQVVALDAVKKKVAFVQQCVIELGVRRLQPVAARVETWRPAEPFAVITARAFASLAEFVQRTEPLLAPGGRWVAMKGAAVAEELAELPATVQVVTVAPVAVPFLNAQRNVVILERA